MKINEFREQFPQYNDMSDEALAKSLHAKHYADMEYADFAARFGVAAQPRQNRALGAAREAIQGATFEFADEIGSGLAAGAARVAQEVGLAPDTGETYGEIYRGMLDSYRAERESFREENPALATTANIAGSVALPGAAGAKLVGKFGQASRPQRAGTLAAVGGTEGALFGAGAAQEGERGSGAAQGAAIGAVFAPAASAGANAAASAVSRRAARKAVENAAPTQQGLKKLADETYAKADSLGIELTPAKVGQMRGQLTTTAKNAAFDPDLHPKVSAALRSFDDLDNDVPTLSRLELQRRKLQAAAQSPDRDERRVASILIGRYDDMISSLSPSDVVRGNAPEAGDVLKSARRLYQRQAKLRVIEEAIDRAQNQATGFENGLRVQFRQILNNEKKRRGFTPEEIQDMQRIVRGGKGENVLKLLGRFGFGEGQATNMLGGSIGVAAGSAVGGPAGAVAVPIAGQMARNQAQRLTRNNVDQLKQRVASGMNPRAIVAQYSKVAGADATPQELAEMFVTASDGDLMTLSAQLNGLKGKQRNWRRPRLVLLQPVKEPSRTVSPASRWQ